MNKSLEILVVLNVVLLQNELNYKNTKVFTKIFNVSFFSSEQKFVKYKVCFCLVNLRKYFLVKKQSNYQLFKTL